MNLPYKIIYLPWLFIFFLHLIPVFKYEILSFEVLLFITLYLILTGLSCRLQESLYKPPLHKYIIPNKNYFRLIIIASYVFISIKLILIFESGLVQQFGISIYAITQMRYEKHGVDVGGNSSFLSITSSVLSGFPILCILSLLYFKIMDLKISKKIRYNLYFIIPVSCLLYISGGGRNSIVFILFIILISYLLLKKIAFSKKDIINIIKFKKKVRVFVLIIIGIVISVSVARTDFKDNNNNVSKAIYYKKGFGVDVNPIFIDLINDNAYYSDFVATSLTLHYYFTHSTHELNKTLNSTPINAPYYGAYQFYTYGLLINKLGGDVIDINQIQDEIVNNGKYFGLIGAFYLDFDIGSFLVFIILGSLFGRFWKSFLITRSFTSFLGFIIISLVLVLSPIYSVIGISVFTSLLTALIFTSVIAKRFNFYNKLL